MAVATGTAKYVVCYRALNGRSGHRYSAGVVGRIVTSDLIHWSWYMPFGLLTPASWVAMFTQRYMHEYGATSARPRAGRDLDAQPRRHQPARVLLPAAAHDARTTRRRVDRRAAPALRLLPGERRRLRAADRTTPERARDLQQKPALIRGVAQAAGADQEAMTSFYRPSICVPPGDGPRREAGLRADPGLAPDDVDAAIIYDAFTLDRALAARVVRLLQAAARRRTSSGTATLDARRPAADQHPRRPAQRGLHPRHERRERGRAADPRHVASTSRRRTTTCW